MDIVWKILWGIIGISLLVTIHEYGHYWVARKLGFKVLRFSVGFGKPIWKRIGRAPDHIEYVLAAIPLGGYVRMLDERDGEVPPQDRPRAFTSKPPWQRILVLLAGPAANVLFAILVLWVMFWVQGLEQVKPVAGDITLGKPAAEAGLRSRDLILAVNGKPVADEGQLIFGLLDGVSGDGPVVMRVRSASGAERDVTMPLDDRELRFELTKSTKRNEPNKLLSGLGFDFWTPTIPPRIFKVIEGEPADLAGLEAGDLLLSADGNPLPDWNTATAYIRERPGKEILLKVRRGNEELSVRATTGRAQDGGKEIGRLGFERAHDLLQYYPPEYVTRVDLGPVKSLAAGAAKAWEITAAQATFFWRVLTTRISTDNFSSLITIADYAGRAASAGPEVFLSLLVLLSLSLGFLNLLPIPILDGGQIVFQVAEWIRGRPLSERVYMVGQQAGLVAIMLLMGVALFNDLSTYLFAGAGK
jgi:regulator of sigma E protease